MPKRILIVDSDAAFLEHLRDLLSGAGYDVATASSGAEAIRALDQQATAIHLVMLELALSGISGFELIGMLTRRPNPIKIIAFSAVHKAGFLKLAMDLGAHFSLPKPAAGEPLLEEEWLGTVKKVLA